MLSTVRVAPLTSLSPTTHARVCAPLHPSPMCAPSPPPLGLSGPGQKAMVVLTQEVADGGRVKKVCPVLKPKYIMGTEGDSMAGKPSFALGYVAEGASMFGAQYNPEKFPLTPELKAKGLTDEKWAEICKMLREGKGMTGFGGGFSVAIANANSGFLNKIGCVGVYAEYGPGQKCMVVLDSMDSNCSK